MKLLKGIRQMKARQFQAASKEYVKFWSRYARNDKNTWSRTSARIASEAGKKRPWSAAAGGGASADIGAGSDATVAAGAPGAEGALLLLVFLPFEVVSGAASGLFPSLTWSLLPVIVAGVAGTEEATTAADATRLADCKPCTPAALVLTVLAVLAVLMEEEAVDATADSTSTSAPGPPRELRFRLRTTLADKTGTSGVGGDAARLFPALLRGLLISACRPASGLVPDDATTLATTSGPKPTLLLLSFAVLAFPTVDVATAEEGTTTACK
jgi:hypothetical protein